MFEQIERLQREYEAHCVALDEQNASLHNERRQVAKIKAEQQSREKLLLQLFRDKAQADTALADVKVIMQSQPHKCAEQELKDAKLAINELTAKLEEMALQSITSK